MLQNASLILLLSFSCWQAIFNENGLKNTPLHFAMNKEYEAAVGKEKVLTFQGKDTSLIHDVFLLSSEAGFPLLFYSDILTPVCIDNICKPMSIEIYWNLLGAYVGYGVFSEAPLTKYDHDLFEAADYEKLHQLLLNRHSILERRELSDLFDADAVAEEKVKFKGREVDAISGATKKEIKESVVEGALYSCYTIWRLAHGEVERKMSRYLDDIYTSQLAEYFLYSDYEDYQLYALKNLEAASFEAYLPRIIEIFHKSKPVTRRYILKKTPKILLKDETTASQLYQDFTDLDINSKTLLVNNLEYAHPNALEFLAWQVESMTRNQLRAYLDFLKSRRDYQNEIVRTELKKIADDQKYTYSHLIAAFLNEE